MVFPATPTQLRPVSVLPHHLPKPEWGNHDASLLPPLSLSHTSCTKSHLISESHFLHQLYEGVKARAHGAAATGTSSICPGATLYNKKVETPRQKRACWHQNLTPGGLEGQQVSGSRTFRIAGRQARKMWEFGSSAPTKVGAVYQPSSCPLRSGPGSLCPSLIHPECFCLPMGSRSWLPMGASTAASAG